MKVPGIDGTRGGRVGSFLDRLILAAAPWRLIRPSLSRRFARLHPRTSAASAAYLVVYVLAAAGLWFLSPWLLAPFALAAAAASLQQLRRSSAKYLRSSGVPPGPLPIFPVAPLTDHRFVAKHVARHGAVSKAAFPRRRRPVVCVHGLRQGAALLREQEERLKWVGIRYDSFIPAGFIRSMSPDDHRRYKGILRSAFTDSVVVGCTPFFAETARGELAEASSSNGAAPAGIDLRPALGRFTVSSFARLFLGVVPGTADHAVIQTLYTEPGPLYARPGGSAELERAAANKAAGIVRRQAAEISATIASGNEPVPSFLSELVRSHGDAVEDPNIVLNLVCLLATGSRDVTGLLHWIVKMLGENPAWIERARRENGSGDLCRRIVSETLRLAQSEYIARRTVEAFELDGLVVPAGWYVRVCVQESHRDPAVFPHPDTFDPDRFLQRRYTRDEYAPFGMLGHACIGVSATMALAETFVRELAHGSDLRLVRDGSIEYDGFHWRPSRRLRVSLTPALGRSD